MLNKYLYTTGEFATLNNINKRTLHYYDEIGLFSPACKDPDTGYRYYTCYQTTQLSFIRMMRESGSGIKEIMAYTSHPSSTRFQELAKAQQSRIDAKINDLLKAKDFLSQKMEKLTESEHIVNGMIECTKIAKAKLLLSAPINGRYEDADFKTAADFTDRLKKQYTLFESFGSRRSVDDLMTERYDCFYYKTPDDQKDYDAVRPGGMALCGYCIGSWDRLPEIYTKMLSYAEKHSLKLYDYAYEEGMNEAAIADSSQYITRILIPCKEKDES